MVTIRASLVGLQLPCAVDVSVNVTVPLVVSVTDG